MFKYPEDIDWEYAEVDPPPEWSCSHECGFESESHGNGNTLVFVLIAIFFGATIFSTMHARQKTEKKRKQSKSSYQSEETRE